MLHESGSTDLSDEGLLQRQFLDRRRDQKGQAQLDPGMDVDRWALFGRSQPQRRQNTLRPNPLTRSALLRQNAYAASGRQRDTDPTTLNVEDSCATRGRHPR